MAEDRSDTRLVQELLDARLDARIVELKTRLDAMDHALKITQEFPTTIDKAIHQLRELHDERFAALERRLEEQRVAQEKARDKAEESITAQLKQLESAHESRNETTRTMLGALKERVTLIEGGRAGASSVWGWVVGIVGLFIAALAVGVRVL